MRRVVINMQNKLFCHAISDTLRRSGNELEPYTVDLPDQVAEECKWLNPYAILLEVTGYTPWMLCERIKLRDIVRAKHPECKIVFIVDENAEKRLQSRSSRRKKTALSTSLSMALSLLPIWLTLWTACERR